MRYSRFWVVIILCLQALPGWGASPATNEALRAVAQLSDGSRIVGEPALATLPLESTFAGKLEIPVRQLRSIKFNSDQKSAALLLRNGDKIEGSIPLVSFRLTTAFGVVDVPRQHLKEIQIMAGGPAAATEGLILHFALTDNDPEKVRDGGPNNLKSTIRGAKPVQDGYEFNGNDDHIAVPFDPSFAIAAKDPFTLAAWVRPNPRQGDYQAIFVTALPNAGYEWEWGLYLDPQSHFMSGWEGKVPVISQTVVEGGQWYYVAATYQDGDWVLYVNGVQEAKTHLPRVLETRGGLAIGRKGESTVAKDAYRGVIRDVRVYNRALTAEEISQLHRDTALPGR